MNAKPEEMFMQAWKAQLDAGLRAIETLTESAIRMHEVQLSAATQAHADAEATRAVIAAATDPAQLTKLCAEWARGNAGKSFAYWRSLLQAGTPQAASGMLKPEMIDGAYQQWLDTVQRFYNPLAKSGS